jgi:DNA-binding HxlR family transcriptional regulator
MAAEPVPHPTSDLPEVCGRYLYAIELVGMRWTGAILRALVTGSHRYAEIKAAIPGISDTMLAARLHTLEAEGLVSRQVVPTSAVQVRYRLTEKGQDLAPAMDAVIAWAHKWVPTRVAAH